jgi:hypothetical protein
VELNYAGAVYGTVTVGALLAAESVRRETYAETIGAVALAMVLYWVAHAYSDSVEDRIRKGEHLTAKGFARDLGHELPILAGAVIPLLVLLILGLAGASLATAVSAAIWTDAGVIAAIETAAAIRSGSKGREMIAQVAVGIGLGLMVIAIRVVLHP